MNTIIDILNRKILILFLPLDFLFLFLSELRLSISSLIEEESINNRSINHTRKASCQTSCISLSFTDSRCNANLSNSTVIHWYSSFLPQPSTRVPCSLEEHITEELSCCCFLAFMCSKITSCTEYNITINVKNRFPITLIINSTKSFRKISIRILSSCFWCFEGFSINFLLQILRIS